MHCQLLLIFVLIVGTYSSDYDYAADSTEDSLDCEDTKPESVCNLINRLIEGTQHKSIGMQLLDTVERKELVCVRSVEYQRKEFTKKIGIVRESLRVMNDSVSSLTTREKKLELAIKSKQKEADELRNTLNNLNTAVNEQNAQVLAEKRRLEAEIAIARARILELETELDKVKRQKKNIEKEIQNLSDLNKSLVDQNIELLNTTATACTMHVKTITDLETKVEDLKQQKDLERDTCNTRVDKLEVDAKKCGVEKENTYFNLEQCKKGEDILNLQLQNLTNEVKETKIALDSVKTECKSNEGKCDETGRRLNEKVQIDAEKCKAEKQQLENDKNEQNNSQNEKISQILAENDKLEGDLAAARAKILKIESDLEAEKKEKDNRKEEVKKLLDENRSLVTANNVPMNNSNQTAKECALQAKTITDLESKVETMKQQQAQERDTYNTKLNKLEDNAKKCEAQNANINSNLEQYKNDENTLKNQLQSLTNEVKEANIALDTVKSECKTNQDKCAEKENTANENVNKMQREVNNCKADKQQLKSDKGKVEAKLITTNEELEKCLTATSTTKFFTTTSLPLPKDAVRLSTGIYIFNQNRMSWDNARNFCKSRSMDLLSIESTEENEAITKKLRIYGHDENDKENAIQFPSWTSGCYKDARQSWFWQNTGSKFSYENWDANQENEIKEGQCVLLFTFSDKWFRSPKTSKFGFICEL